MFDFSHAFFRPRWRRIALVVFCMGWGVFELTNSAPIWAAIFFGFAGMSFWKLFLDQENIKKLDETGDD